MRTLVLFASSLMVLFFLACNEKQDHSPFEFDLDRSFNLGYKNTGHCSCGDLSITFADVEEGVFPIAGVGGVLEDESRVQLDVMSNDGAQSIELVHRLTMSTFDRDTVGGYTISLFQVSPYPQGEQTVRKQDYEIRLMVEEL